MKRQALNELDAYDICNKAFQQSTYYETCLQIVPNFSNETLVNCMNDLVVSNNYNRLWSGIIQNIRFKMFKCIDTNKH